MFASLCGRENFILESTNKYTIKFGNNNFANF